MSQQSRLFSVNDAFLPLTFMLERQAFAIQLYVFSLDSFYSD
jgi:hypothetical protein